MSRDAWAPEVAAAMTRSADIPARRAVALLLVVAALAIVAVGAAALAAMASSARAASSLDRSEAIAGELLVAARAPIDRWLSRDAASTALPPDAAMPATGIVDESWQLDGVEMELRVTAFDQLGMVSWDHARGGSILRLVLPEDVVEAVSETPTEVPAGLDLVAARSGRRVFPLAPALEPGGPPALGALVSTHASSPARINVNTAPAELLEQAFRAAGRGGADAVLASRASGRPAPAPAAASAPTAGSASGRRERPAAVTDAWRVELVGSSDAWAFRIDVRAGRLRRSWWEVHRPGTEGRWECVQRLAVDE